MRRRHVRSLCSCLFVIVREREKLAYEITDLQQRAQDIAFLKVTRNVQEYLACRNDAEYESQKQRESQMLEQTISTIKDVCHMFDVVNGFSLVIVLFSLLLAVRRATRQERKRHRKITI
jgi:transposase